MNVQEFAKLKEGDKIVNYVSGRTNGTIVSVEKMGVCIRWNDDPASPSFFYSVNGTAWFHWTKVEEDATT